MAMRAPTYDGLRAGPGGPIGARVPGGAPNLGEPVADGAARVAGVLGDEVARQRARFEDVAVLGAVTELNDFTTNTLHGPDGLLGKRGPAAFEAAGKTLAEWDKRAAAIGARLGTDGARLRFAERQAGERSRLMEVQQRFVSGELDRYDDETTELAAKSAQNAGMTALLAGDAAALGGTIATVESIVRDRYARNAHRLNPAQMEQDVAVARTGLVVGAVNAMLSRGDDEAAAAIFAEYGPAMEPEARAKVQTVVTEASRVGTVEREAQRITRESLATADEATLADRERAALDATDALDDDVRADVRSRVKSNFNDERRLRAQAQEDTLAALDKQRQDGTPLDTIRKTPEWMRLSAEGQRALERLDAMGRANMAEPADPSAVRYDALVRAASNPLTRAAFAAQDMLLLRPELTKAQYDEMVGLQKAIREGSTVEVERFQTADAIVQDAAAIIARRSSKADAEDDRARFVVEMHDEIRRARDEALAAGKPFGEAEVIAVRDRMLGEVVYDNDESKPAFLVDPDSVDPDDIPDADLAELVGAGLPVYASDEEIARAWVYWKRYGTVRAPWEGGR